ncbi:MAG TPA: hypothetical protein VFH13_03955, partial [Gemmatimonadaceae bacterium]|nr:hypothetical protein [Gemmatimonadaceae bacterium]
MIDMAGAFAIRRCAASDAPTLAALGARLFAETYGPTRPLRRRPHHVATDLTRSAHTRSSGDLSVSCERS